jgi:hypothetical protein
LHEFPICGKADTINNDTVYYGPDRALSANTPGLTCDITAAGQAGAAGGAGAGPEDDDVFESDSFVVRGMVCRNEADANNDITFTLYDDTSALTPSVTCTIADDARECVAYITEGNNEMEGITEVVAANSQLAIGAQSTGNIGVGNGFVCTIIVGF